MVATYETDQELAHREWLKGYNAQIECRPITDCPWNGGVAEYWWKEGWHGTNMPAGMVTAL